MTEALVVLVTVPDAERGAALARTLVEERLAACVNVVPGLRSIYRWKDEVADDSEALCLIKSRRELWPRLRDRVLALHPYEVPEVLAFAPEHGAAAYLDWIAESTSDRAER